MRMPMPIAFEKASFAEKRVREVAQAARLDPARGARETHHDLVRAQHLLGEAVAAAREQDAAMRRMSQTSVPMP